MLECNDFNDSYFRMVFYYRVEEVKQSVLWFQQLTKIQPNGDQKQNQTFTDNGEDITSMTSAQRLATQSTFRVVLFSTTGEFYPIDTYQIKSDMTSATGRVYGPQKTYETLTPGPSKYL